MNTITINQTADSRNNSAKTSFLYSYCFLLSIKFLPTVTIRNISNNIGLHRPTIGPQRKCLRMKRCIPSKWKPTYPIIKKNHGKPSVQSITHLHKMTAAAPHAAANYKKNIPTASTFPSNSKTYYPQTQPSKPTVEQIFYFATPPTKSIPIFSSSFMEQEILIHRIIIYRKKWIYHNVRC